MDDSGKDDLDWGVGVSSELYTSISPLLNDESLNLDAIDLSNKAKILFQILDASKAVGEKVLVFSQQLQTLNFLEALCKSQDRKYSRLDGKSAMSKRQMRAKDFNINDHEVYLISTNAGGLGLNLPGANRVVIFDFKFNPIQEEQAVGRAYRLGQDKPVYVYRLIAGGTFETFVHNKAVFKEQLASRVVDKKNPIARATRGFSEYLFEPRQVEQQDLSEFKNMDPDVLDKILESQETSATIRSIVQSDTFEKEDEAKLTPEELKEVKQDIEDERLKRSDPVAYRALLQNRTRALYPPPPMAANQRHLVQGYGSSGMQHGAMPQGVRSGVIGPSAVGLPSATNGRQGPQGSINDLRVSSEVSETSGLCRLHNVFPLYGHSLKAN
jgi:superfamily II DNA/RNA helicase